MPDKETSINNLKADHKNARKRTSQSKFLIEESLKRYGAARSIVIDESGRILAGNGTVEGAKQAGISKVRIVETDGDEIIAVRRTGLSEDEKIGLALADNRTSDLSEWDGDMLQQLSDNHDISPWFSEDDLNEILNVDDDQSIEDEADDQTDKLKPQYSIIIECGTEEEQTATLETLLNQGFNCKALNS